MNGFPQFDLNGQVPLVTGAARGLGRAILLALVLACAVEFDFSVESALAQGPQPGAPASDVSNIPKPVTDTFDRVRMRNGPNDAQAGHKSAEKEDTCLLPPLTLVHSPMVATAALQVPAKAKKEYGEACGR